MEQLWCKHFLLLHCSADAAAKWNHIIRTFLHCRHCRRHRRHLRRRHRHFLGLLSVTFHIRPWLFTYQTTYATYKVIGNGLTVPFNRLSYGIVNVILSLVVVIQYRHVSDRHMMTANTALAQRRTVNMYTAAGTYRKYFTFFCSCFNICITSAETDDIAVKYKHVTCKMNCNCIQLTWKLQKLQTYAVVYK